MPSPWQRPRATGWCCGCSPSSRRWPYTACVTLPCVGRLVAFRIPRQFVMLHCGKTYGVSPLMTTQDEKTGVNSERFDANIAKIEELSQRLVAGLSRKKAIDQSLQGPSQELYMKAANAYLAEMMANPSKILEHQISYWGKSLKHYVESTGSSEQRKIGGANRFDARGQEILAPDVANAPLFQLHQAAVLMSSEPSLRPSKTSRAWSPTKKSGWNFSVARSSTCSARQIFWAPIPRRCRKPWKPKVSRWSTGWKTWCATLKPTTAIFW